METQVCRSPSAFVVSGNNPLHEPLGAETCGSGHQAVIGLDDPVAHRVEARSLDTIYNTIMSIDELAVNE